MAEYNFKDIRVLENVNELYPELLGLAINMLPWAACTSPSRMIMLASQISQSLVTKSLSRNRYFTGVEREYGKYTFNVRAEYDCEIIQIISKFTPSLARNSPKQNPMKLYVVRDIKRDIYDVIEMPSYCSHHNNFGWEYKVNESLVRGLKEGKPIRKGEILADSPSVQKDGRYVCSRLTNVASISDKWGTEDGLLASNEWCEENIATGFLDLDVIPPKGYYWVNLYGDEATYKPFPGPGDKIRSDGLIAALRKHSDILGAVELAPKYICEPDYHFDKLYYIEGSAHNPRIVDLDILDTEQDNFSINPVPTKDSLDYYDGIRDYTEKRIKYHQKLIDAYEEIRRRNRWKEPNISPHFSYLLKQSKMIVRSDYRYDDRGRKIPVKAPKNIEYKYRSPTIYSQHLKIRIMYDVIPDLGYKFSGLYGNKGVLCKKKPRAEMYRDKWGHVCDLVFDAYPTLNRMIASWSFEMTWNAFCRDFEERCREYDHSRPNYLDELYEQYLEFIEIAAPLHYENEMEYQPSKAERDETILKILDGDILDLYLPPNTETIGVEMLAQLFDRYELRKDTLTLVTDSGVTIETVDKHLIGQAAIIMLEKTGHDFAAIDTPKRQIHGVPAKLTSQDKHGSPQRGQSQRVGEAEYRNFLGNIDPSYSADQIDRANNPRAQEEISYNLLSSVNPSNLYTVIDRTKNPVGEGLHLSYLRNALYVAGAEFVYIDSNADGDK